jgi:hypothetical protein
LERENETRHPSAATRRVTLPLTHPTLARSPHLNGIPIHWTVLHHATQPESKEQIDDGLETGARDRGFGLLQFCVRGSGAAGGRGWCAEAFSVENQRDEGRRRLSVWHDPCRQTAFYPLPSVIEDSFKKG